ncbi:MAG TPA: ATP-binding protein [Candidatus Acidoferrales bacterium]
MMKIRDSLSKKLIVMNMMVSAGALLLASIALFGYDFLSFRTRLINSTSVQAQIIGANEVSPLIFHDSASAENTLSALRASRRIVYAGIYSLDGQFFSGYWRDNPARPIPLPPFAPSQKEYSWFKSGGYGLVQTIMFEGKPVGIVYIWSDLSAVYDRLTSYGLILLATMGASLIAALILARISQRVLSEPILSLADVARRVSRERNYGLRAPETGTHDEVSFLVGAFNEMLLEIQTRDLALNESERQFRTLADSIPQLAWMAEPDGHLVWYNHRWYEYTGTSPQQMAERGWQQFHDPAILPEVEKRWRASLATGQPFEMIFPLRGVDGESRLFLTLAKPVRDAHGSIVRWFGTNTDVTEQRRSEEALRQTEKLAATGRLAASIAHEINNPLEAVTNLVYLARKQPVNVQKYLTMADQELDRIAQITKNTLGFYRDSASASEVNISEVLKEVLALYSRKLGFKKIVLRPEYGDDIKILGFPGEIRQIFANLTSNAIEALSEGGSLVIRASKSCTRNGSVRQGVRVTFLDNGTGIALENRKRIFEPFYTTKKDVGTGLGLWLTLGLIKKHQGLLNLRSSVQPGKTWTAFSVFLPDQPSKDRIATDLT